MTDEEIVALIQEGDTGLCCILWPRVEKLVAWKARRYINAIPGRRVEFDELMSAGYLALVAAAFNYTPGPAKFTTYLMYHLTNEFCKVGNHYIHSNKKDASRGAVSLSTPLSDEDGSDELDAVVPDPAATEAFEDTEEQIYREQLQAAVAAALQILPENQAEILKLRYLEGLPGRVVSEMTGWELQEVRKQELMALRILREPRNAKHLRPFWNFDYYSGTGAISYRYSGMSVQEKYLLHKEKLEEMRNHEQAQI